MFIGFPHTCTPKDLRTSYLLEHTSSDTFQGKTASMTEQKSITDVYAAIANKEAKAGSFLLMHLEKKKNLVVLAEGVGSKFLISLSGLRTGRLFFLIFVICLFFSS